MSHPTDATAPPSPLCGPISLTQATSLHPWDTEDPTPPAAVDIQIAGDRIALDFPGMDAEMAVEIDKGVLRLLVWTKAGDVDTPLSVRWTPEGLSVDAREFQEDGGQVAIAAKRR